MDLIDEPVELPRLTRLVRSISLCITEGLSLGVVAATFVQAEKLAQFVATNQTAQALRKEMLACVLLPAMFLPLALGVACAIPVRSGRRLRTFERWTRLLAPLTACGFIPLVFRPTLWHDKSLAFLLVTGLFSWATVTALRMATRAWSDGRTGRRDEALASVFNAVAARISPRLVTSGCVALIVAILLWSLTRSTGVANFKVQATGIAHELATIRQVSDVGGVSAWFGAKAIRATGHASYLGALDSIVNRIWPGPEALLSLRLALVSFSAVPLFFWCKRALGKLPALMVSIAFLSMPLPGMLLLKDSFPLTCALGCFFAGAYCLETRRTWRGLAVIAIGILFNEQVALWCCLLGVYLATSGARKRLGTGLAWASLGYFVTIALVALPHLGVRTYSLDTPNVTSIGAHYLASTSTALVVNPAYALSQWFEAQSLEYWLALCVPMAFLPFYTRRWIIWLAPVLLFAMTLPTQDAGSQWRDPAYGHFLALGFLAVVANLRQIGRSDTPNRLLFRTALVGWVAALAPCVAMFGSLYYRPL